MVSNTSKAGKQRFWDRWLTALGFKSGRQSRVDYSNPAAPRRYKCAHCGATGCKLWRDYNRADSKILCATCTAKDQRTDISTIDGQGRTEDEYGMTRSSIGFYVPAVPDSESSGFWGNTSGPREAWDWWRKLPTFPASAPDRENREIVNSEATPQEMVSF